MTPKTKEQILEELQKQHPTSIPTYKAMDDYAKQQNEELIDILTDLVQLKEWKDKNGKDEHYLKHQPFTWARAKLALLNAKTNQT